VWVRIRSKIIDGFAPEFERLVYAMLLAPWDEQLDPAVARHALLATEPRQHCEPPATSATGTVRKRRSAAKAAGIRSASRRSPPRVRHH